MKTPPQVQRFSLYTDAELLVIDNQELNDAIRREAIERGIKPPVTLSEALLNSEWRGYQQPASFIEVFRISVDGGYRRNPLEIGFLKQEDAERALRGMVRIFEDGYGDKAKMKIGDASPTVERVLIGDEPQKVTAAKFQAYMQDDTEFNAVVEECTNRYSEVRQADYNRRVTLERRAEYLRLANDNEEIARAFWQKAEKTPWPEDVPTQPDEA